MNRRLARILTITLPLCAGTLGCASDPPAAPATMRFEFHSAFLMNLHNFLFDAANHPGRIDRVKWDVPPTVGEMATLHEAVAYYTASFHDRDPLDDDGLRDIRHALSRADDASRQAAGRGLPPSLAAMLDRAAPIYARCLWASQDARNRDWIAHVEALEARYGAKIQPRLERVFQAKFPPSIRDDIVVGTGTFTGAYTDAPPPQSVIPSGWEEYGGLASLEMIWHEASHAGPADHLDDLIQSEARALNREFPDNLWHAAQFEAVGTEVREVLKEDGVDYVPYADKNHVYRGRWAQYVPLLREQWKAWLDGRGDLKDAVDAMLRTRPLAAKPAA
jgi:hypothetical protein